MLCDNYIYLFLIKYLPFTFTFFFYNLAMNILKKLLFSFKGKIGRADFIYGMVYTILLFCVSVDTFIYPSPILLIGGGVDIPKIGIYIGSIIGLVVCLWIYIAVTLKRARALSIEPRWILFGIVFPPLLLVGFLRDTEKYTYH